MPVACDGGCGRRHCVAGRVRDVPAKVMPSLDVLRDPGRVYAERTVARRAAGARPDACRAGRGARRGPQDGRALDRRAGLPTASTATRSPPAWGWTRSTCGPMRCRGSRSRRRRTARSWPSTRTARTSRGTSGSGCSRRPNARSACSSTPGCSWPRTPRCRRSSRTRPAPGCGCGSCSVTRTARRSPSGARMRASTTRWPRRSATRSCCTGRCAASRARSSGSTRPSCTTRSTAATTSSWSTPTSTA